MSTRFLKLCLAVLIAGGLGSSRGAEPAGSPAETPPQYSIFEYFQHRLATEKPLLDFPADPRRVPEWRDRVTARLRLLLGLDLSTPAPLRPRRLEVRRRDGYRVEHVEFTSEAGVDVPGFVLIPDGVSAQHPAPAVLCLQGMVPGGKDELAGETEHDPEAAAGLKNFHDDFARQLTRAGFVTLAIDLRFDGERSFHTAADTFGLNNRGVADTVAGDIAQMMGQTFYGLNLFDCQRALDYLETRPEVDRRAVGAAGFSFGSQLAAWLAGMDRRIKVVALEGNWPSMRRLALRPLTGAGDIDLGQPGNPRQYGKRRHEMVGSSFQFLPGFVRYVDFNSSIAIAAPTPMVVSCETGRWQYHNQAEIDADLAPLYGAYAAFGKSDDLHLVNVQGPHYWRQEIILPWFTARLRALAAAGR